MKRHQLEVVAEWEEGDTPINSAMLASVVKAVITEMLTGAESCTVRVNRPADVPWSIDVSIG